MAGPTKLGGTCIPGSDDGALRHRGLPVDIVGRLVDAETNVVIASASFAAEQLLALWQDAGPQARVWLWEVFGDSLAGVCRPEAQAPAKARVAVAGSAFGFEVVSVNDYTLDRIRRSEDIDLDHLSSPLPR